MIVIVSAQVLFQQHFSLSRLSQASLRTIYNTAYVEKRIKIQMKGNYSTRNILFSIIIIYSLSHIHGHDQSNELVMSSNLLSQSQWLISLEWRVLTVIILTKRSHFTISNTETLLPPDMIQQEVRASLTKYSRPWLQMSSSVLCYKFYVSTSKWK